MNKTIPLFAIVLMLSLFNSCNSCNSNSGRKMKPTALSSSCKAEKPKPNFNVYIENSGSMNGYVKGVTEFEQAVYNYLSDIKIAKITDSLNLYYINSEIIPLGTVSDEMDVLKDFVEKLEPSTFQMKGGALGTSDISNVLKSVLKNTNKHSVSILVTDGIFSPGKNKSADQYLVNQQIGIKNSFSSFLAKEQNAAVIVYQLSSQFEGSYYNKEDAIIPLTAQRPFYIWVIGNAESLSDLASAIPTSKFNGSGVKNIFTVTTGGKKIKYALNPSIGKYTKSYSDTKTTIEDLEKDSRTGKVKFAVNVDFSGLLLDDTYILDIRNYENTSKYQLDVKPSSVKNIGYTHTLYFCSDKVYKGSVVVKLKAQRPMWVEDANDDIGLTAIEGKTYGIKHQIDGVFGAFTFDNKYYTEIKININ